MWPIVNLHDCIKPYGAHPFMVTHKIKQLKIITGTTLPDMVCRLFQNYDCFDGSILLEPGLKIELVFLTYYTKLIWFL